jgi:signal transduction histidine kinase
VVPSIATSAVFDVALAIPLLWRRRHPLEAFLVTAAIALVQAIAGTVAAGDIALLLGLYAVGAHDDRRWAVPTAAATAQVGVLLAAMRWDPAGDLLSSMLLLTGTVTAPWVVGRYVRTRRAYVESVLERASTAERERDQAALQAVADERARISRDMHDIVAHSLSVMVTLSDGAAMSFARAPNDAKEAMEQTSIVGRQALDEMRRLLGVLTDSGHPELSPQPGVADIDELVSQVRATGLAVEHVVVGEQLDLPASAQLAVYRAVQEGLTNVLKHAQAPTRAAVTLRYLASGIDVEVDNDDEPDRVDKAPVRIGRGLTGMRERAASYGGTLEAFRRSDGGWHVASHLPFGDGSVPS